MIIKTGKRKFIGGCAALALSIAAAFIAPTPTSAQWIVYDPSNFSQNVLTAARTLQQINNQIQSLQNEAQMILNQGQSLANQARNLANLATSPLAMLQQDIARTNALIAQAQGLTTQIGQLNTQFSQQYPNGYGAGTTANQTLADARTQWSNSLEGLRTTLQMQAQLNGSITSDQGTLADIVGSSQGAIGILQATQATNQLLALMTKQVMQSQQLALSQGRSTALEQARMLEAEEQGRANRTRFKGAGVQYTPATVQVYP